MTWIIAELTGPVPWHIEADDDPRFAIKLLVRQPGTSIAHPLPLRYVQTEQALRDSVEYDEFLGSQLATLQDALDRGDAALSSSLTRGSPGVVWLLVAVLALAAATLLPELPSAAALLGYAVAAAALLVVGFRWADAGDRRVEMISTGDPGLAVDRARATLLLVHRPTDGNVVCPAVRLEDSAGAVAGYVVPSTTTGRLPRRFPLDALVRSARNEIDQPRQLREIREQREAERRRLESGVEHANLSLHDLRELDAPRRPRDD